MNLHSLPPWLLLGGGGLLGGQLLGWVRGQSSSAWELLRRRFTSTLTVDEYESGPFYAVLAWCRHYLPDATHLTVLQRRADVEYGPAPGLYVVRYHGRRVLVEREQYSAGPQGEGRPLARLRLTVLGKHRELLTAILAEGQHLYEPASDRLSITVQDGGYWGTNYREPVRPLASVLLDGALRQELVADVAQFLASRAWYEGLALSWQRGYLLYGPPGNGKTSLIRALASHFGLPLYVLNLADPKVGDGELAQMLLSVGRAVVLLEDIDAVLPSRLAGSERTNLSFTGVLNALDGVVAASGRLVFMSSNHPEALDAALVRPGRVDKRVLLDNACGEQVAALFDRFFPGMSELQEALVNEWSDARPLSMATVQGALLQYHHDAVGAYKELMHLGRHPPPLVLPAVRSCPSAAARPAPCAPQLPRNSLIPATHGY